MVAWGVDGLRAISVGFLIMSREAWMVFDLRKADGWEIIGPRSSPVKGKLGGY